jgi:hypothetical protein
VAFFLTAVFTEIYLCNVCSRQEILRRNADTRVGVIGVRCPSSAGGYQRC